MIDVGEQIGEPVVERDLPTSRVAAQPVALVGGDLQLVDQLRRAVRVGQRVALGRELRFELRDGRQHLGRRGADHQLLAFGDDLLREIRLEFHES